MNRSQFVLSLLGAAVACPANDAKAVAIAESMMRAMGGLEAYSKARYLSFSFFVIAGGKYVLRRYHLWDRATGRYRLETHPLAGPVETVLFNVNTRTGAAAAKKIEEAYQAHINDSYWLLMPWKWLDAGVNLRYLGERTYKGGLCDAVELSFQKVGLTPGDTYQAYVSRASGLMVRWTYTLQNRTKGDWDWEYKETAGIQLPRTHRSSDGKEINMGNVQAAAEWPSQGMFEDPAQTLLRKR